MIKEIILKTKDLVTYFSRHRKKYQRFSKILTISRTQNNFEIYPGYNIK